jgi:hypothetical protein
MVIWMTPLRGQTSYITDFKSGFKFANASLNERRLALDQETAFLPKKTAALCPNAAVSPRSM